MYSCTAVQLYICTALNLFAADNVYGLADLGLVICCSVSCSSSSICTEQYVYVARTSSLNRHINNERGT